MCHLRLRLNQSIVSTGSPQQLYCPYWLAEMGTVCSWGRTPRSPKEQGCRYTKLIHCMYNNNRYRYHKNTIILLIICSLVGISDCSLLELVLFMARTMGSLYSHVRRLVRPYFHAIIPSHLFDSNIIVATYNQTNGRMINCHASLRLSCHLSM